MSDLLFYSLIIIRVISPPIIFKYMHPFYAMIVDECIVDGLIAPHHLFRQYIPQKFLVHRKPHYDIPLDLWGFLNGLQPIMCKKHKYYYVFKGYRQLLLSLFIWRLIGIILLYIIRDPRILAIFSNFFIGTYLAISGCHLFKIKNKRKINAVILISVLFFYIRQLYLIHMNLKFKTIY